MFFLTCCNANVSSWLVTKERRKHTENGNVYELLGCLVGGPMGRESERLHMGLVVAARPKWVQSWEDMYELSLTQFLKMPKGWNETIVVLIPKVFNPEKLKELRPISLCNVLYKIASKVLLNHLKVILPDIISLNQSDFVPGRLIIDNVLLAYELTYYMQNKRKGVDGYAAIKLDMSKVMTVSSGDS
jgi:hypothetical protein